MLFEFNIRQQLIITISFFLNYNELNAVYQFFDFLKKSEKWIWPFLNLGPSFFKL